MVSRAAHTEFEPLAATVAAGRPRLLGLLDSADGVRFRLSAELTRQLREVASQKNVSLFVTLLSGWAVLLGRWLGHEELVICIRGASGRHSGSELQIGCESATALRIQVREDSTIEQMLKQVRSAVAEARMCEDVPFEVVADALDPDRNLAWVFQIVMRLDDSSTAIIPSTKLEVTSAGLSGAFTQSPQFPSGLSLALSETKNALVGTLECASDFYERRTIERMVASWKVLLEGMVEDIGQPISELQILTAPEREQVLHEFNDTIAAYPQGRLLHELFEEQVRRAPEAVAVVYEEQRQTYSELNGRANQLARYLREKGVGPDQLVGICIERGPQMVVGILGILKAGGAYVPLDPAYPSERLAYMLKDAAPRVLLTEERLRSGLPITAAEIVTLDSIPSEIAWREDGNLEARSPQLTSRHLAYVIYTSGSTGMPKGVAAEHRGMVNRITAQATIGPFTGDDICCQKTSIGFVDAIFEILGPLSYGRPLVLATEAEAKDVQDLAYLIKKMHITRLVTVPSLAKSLLQGAESTQSLQSLRSWTLSGEELKRELLAEMHERLPNCTFTNLYGSSEVAADVTYYVTRGAEADVRVPIGRPIANTQIYLLDRHLQPVPIGVAGEIYVGGAGVARGYLNRPNITAERFVADPFSQDPEARLYKSGDLGRWRPDGMIEYLGRNDDQVKIRGYRIELGEIEAQLARHARVKEAVVLAREDVLGEKRLVAYVVPQDSSALESAPSVEELKTHLKAALPGHMVPKAFVILERFPLTPNGKLDRRALLPPELGDYVSQQHEAPQGAVEEILAEIWQEVLRVERVGRHDNFFELGGHSLLAMQVTVRIRHSLSVEMPTSIMFESPTLIQLSAQVEQLRQARLLDRLSGGGNEIEEMLERVASMPESKVQELMRELKMGART